MKRFSALILIFVLIFMCSCAKDNEKPENITYKQITQEEAKNIMDSGKDYFLLDVRSEEEYNEGHIPGAVVIPHTEIENSRDKLPENKNTVILVYCRSGRRSKIASEALVNSGYTNVKEFGGINTWEYETEK